jgi:hypothetical protein
MRRAHARAHAAQGFVWTSRRAWCPEMHFQGTTVVIAVCNSDLGVRGLGGILWQPIPRAAHAREAQINGQA